MWETFEIRSKSYTIKWVDIPANSHIEWKLKPQRNSINLGIYKQSNEIGEENTSRHKNSSKAAIDSVKALTKKSSEVLENLNLDEVNQLPHRYYSDYSSVPSSSRSRADSMVDSNHSGSGTGGSRASGDISLEGRLDNNLIKERWIGRCSADAIKSGKINSADGGLYAFVFDNTFSKTKAKTIIFKYDVKMKELPNTEREPSGDLESNDSTKKQPHVKFDEKGLAANRGKRSTRVVNINGIQYLEGYLLKKKRRGGGAKKFSKRFFSLNLTYGILNYYSNDDSNTIRGNMMITQAVVSADSSELMFYLDSGVEQWILKASSFKDFQSWVSACNFIKNQNKKSKDLKRFTSNEIKMGIDDLLYGDDTLDGHTESDYDSDNELDFVSMNSEAADKSLRKGRRHIGNPHIEDVVLQVSTLKKLVQDLMEKEKIGELELKNGAVPLPSSKTFQSQQQLQQQQPIRALSKRTSSKNLGVEKSTNMAATPLTRKPSFLSKLKMRSNSSSTALLTSDGRSSELENSRLKKRSSEEHSVHGERKSECSQTSSISSALSSPKISAFTSTHQTALNSILDQIKVLELEVTHLAAYESGLSRSNSRMSLSHSTTQSRSILSQEFYDAQEFTEKADLGVMMLTGDSTQDLNGENEEFQNELENPDYVEVSTTSSSENYVDINDDANVYEPIPEEKSLHEDVSPSIDGSVSTAAIEKTHTAMALSPLDDTYPLPYEGKYTVRTDIKPAATGPPSLMGILRKNIGKDMSNITMPITMNEPLSFLQQYTESYEYSAMIDEAMKAPTETGERILRIAAFAITYLAAYKNKTRSNRKPFNPLLGETFELVNPINNTRIIVEKVHHNPVTAAAHVNSKNWYIDHSVCPKQTFYGKSAEIAMGGVLKLKFKHSNEEYEWTQPSSLIKNVVSFTGEKYIEPIDKMTITSNTGLKCVVTFISENGRFSSTRSEKVELKVVGDAKSKKPTYLSATGKWTGEIKMSDGRKIWQIAEELPGQEKKYGFTRFSCSLNDMNEIHQKCAPTDSRRRPDQRMYENGIIDEADQLKLKLEKDQRMRRKDANGNEVMHTPKFFTKGNGDEWTFITGEKGYWERRKRGDWDDLIKLW